MKINQHISKTCTFSCEDSQIIRTVILNQCGNSTIKTAMKNGSYYMVLFSAYAKIEGYTSTYGNTTFSCTEKYILTEALRKALYEDDFGYDQNFKDKVKELLEGISMCS